MNTDDEQSINIPTFSLVSRILSRNPEPPRRGLEDAWAQLYNYLCEIPLEDAPISLDRDSLPEFYLHQLSQEQEYKFLYLYEQLWTLDGFEESEGLRNLYNKFPDTKATMLLIGISKQIEALFGAGQETIDLGSEVFDDDETFRNTPHWSTTDRSKAHTVHRNFLRPAMKVSRKIWSARSVGAIRSLFSSKTAATQHARGVSKGSSVVDG